MWQAGSKSMRFASPPLELVYRALRPNERETAFLQACLLDGDAASAGWHRWLELCGAPLAALREDRIGIKRHLPRLYANLVAAGTTIGRDIEPYLRTAVAREQMRSRAFRTALGQSLAALGSNGIRATLLRGAAIGETLLDAPWQRHSHDVDLHVGAADLERAAAALAAAGFQPLPSHDRRKERRVEHSNGLPICLHTRLLDASPASLAEPAMLARALEAEAVGRTVSVLRAEDMLVHVCCHAATHGSRRALGWIIDAVTLIHRPGFDWSQIDASTWDTAGCLLAPSLEVLADVVPGILPSELRERQRDLATPDPAARALLLSAAAVTMGGLELLRRAGSNRDRLV